MRLVSLTAIHARIPLKRRIKHASHARRENDTLLVRAELDDGTVGWGEGLPRSYVTGETIESCFETFREFNRSQIAGPLGGLACTVERLQQIQMPDHPDGRRDCFGNTVRCAIELSILDAVSRAEGVAFSEVTGHVAAAQSLRRPVQSVRYSTAVMSVKPWKEAASALGYRLYGFEQCKVKVGVAGQDEVASLRRIRRYAGSQMDLRIDANEAWRPEDVEPRVKALKRFGITALEQPVLHENVAALARVRPQLAVPIMLDESLCSMGDADRAIGDGLCDLFNIRLSKCGGFISSLLLAAKAKETGLGFQVGCMVGETGILSAAGRHLACSIEGIRYLEGSFDRYLVAERLTKEDLTFGRGGIAPALQGPGLGVIVDAAAVDRVAERKQVWDLR